MNILITSAGRRVSLLRAFEKEMKARLPEGVVIAADYRPQFSSACHVASSSFQLPHVRDSNYLSELIQLCQHQKVKLIVPTIDTELLILSEQKSALRELGITVSVSDPEVIRKCRDKRNTGELFQQYDVNVPEVYDKAGLKYPVFAKPYDGSCSQDLYLLQSEADLTPELLHNDRMMFMEYLSPEEHEEYTVDMYYNRSGHLCCMVPRLRLETRGGEVSKGVTRMFPAFEQLQKDFEQLDGAFGCLTMQFFCHKQSQQLSGIEINPRFGGGFPLSYSAGANFPGWLIDEVLLNQEVHVNRQWQKNLMMLRYDAEVLVHNA